MVLKFSQIKFSSPALMAPMAGYTDKAFRRILKKTGASLLFGEFVSADGLVRENEKSLELLEFEKNERPFGIQLFGSEPEIMANAAQIVENYSPDLIDLNFGCPVPKVVKKGAGAALLKDLPRLEKIAAAVAGAVSLPVTAKIRSGWDRNTIVVTEAARRLEAAGIQAVTVHPRTRSMGYSGAADWNLIKEVKQNLTIPIIGNGDIWQAEDAIRMMKETGCDFVMVARGALRNPWIFRQIQELLSGREPFSPTNFEFLQLIREHLYLAIQYRGEKRALKEIRKFLAFYLKGKPGASRIRSSVHLLETGEEIDNLLVQYYSIDQDKGETFPVLADRSSTV
ncbi:MAG TPA: tRNA dihydrouridine synthase DusB [Bacteroidetes bacterium]|nr:tRNA dihydrouridine synthase DusB [Bacteroidota bacterium]